MTGWASTLEAHRQIAERFLDGRGVLIGFKYRKLCRKLPACGGVKLAALHFDAFCASKEAAEVKIQLNDVSVLT